MTTAIITAAIIVALAILALAYVIVKTANEASDNVKKTNAAIIMASLLFPDNLKNGDINAVVRKVHDAFSNL